MAQEEDARSAEAAESSSTERSSETGVEATARRLSERLEQWLERSPVRPEVGSIVSGSGLAFGVGVRRKSLLGELPLAGEARASWSVRGYQQYDVLVGGDGNAAILPLDSGDSNVTSLFNDRQVRVPGTAAYLAARYRRSPRVDFFGVGPRRPEVETDFSVSGTSVDAVLQWQPTNGVGFSLRAGLLDLDIQSGTDDRTPNLEERFSVSEVPGLLAQPRYATAGLGAVADTRDQAEVPTTGGFFGAAVWRFIPLDAQAESFTRLALDWREYRPIVRNRPDRHVLAFRLLASVDQAATRSPVPFYLQNWLGGSHTLRSYESYRLRGQAVFHVSIEHRWRIRRFLEIGSFVDSGAVATSIPRLTSSPVEFAKGIGVRLRSDKRLYLRLDWAHGAEGNRVVFSLSPAF
jgi:hypothetical protein